MNTSIGTTFSALLALTAAVHGVGPTLQSGVNIGFDVGTRSAPTFADWHNDGMQDMLCGQYTSGKIRLYDNGGTDANPVYSGWEYLQALGSDITSPSC